MINCLLCSPFLEIQTRCSHRSKTAVLRDGTVNKNSPLRQQFELEDILIP